MRVFLVELLADDATLEGVLDVLDADDLEHYRVLAAALNDLARARTLLLEAEAHAAQTGEERDAARARFDTALAALAAATVRTR